VKAFESLRVLGVAALGLAPVWLGGCERSSSDPGKPGAGTNATVPLVPLTNMVRIPAGSFQQLNRRVTLTRDFWLARFEVTQAEYAALMGTNPSHFAGHPEWPVEKVRHVDAVAYCAELTRRERAAGRLPPDYEYRLPTEAEWEYACRAGSTNRYSFGEDETGADAHAWTEENSNGHPHPVGQKAPNAWGLHDMHGNVWEWCHDWFAEFSPGDAVDPAGPATGTLKVFRGGSWNHAAKFARCANRFMMAPSNGIYFVGFRVALGPVPGKSR
jgi:formylglycine-generating enzyme required for sulfatase activity